LRYSAVAYTLIHASTPLILTLIAPVLAPADADELEIELALAAPLVPTKLTKDSSVSSCSSLATGIFAVVPLCLISIGATGELLLIPTNLLSPLIFIAS